MTNDNSVSTVEVVNVMLGEGNDDLTVEGTLNPAPHVSAQNTFQFINWSDAAYASKTGGNALHPEFANKLVVTRQGFNWKGEGFLVGQELFVVGANGVRTSLGRIIGIEDALAYGLGQIDPATGQPYRDPNDNSLLVLDISALPAGVDSGPLKLVAEDRDVSWLLQTTVTSVNAGLSTIKWNGITGTGTLPANWKEAGFLEGHLFHVDRPDGTRLDLRLVSISGDGKSIEVEGLNLTAGATLNGLYWVQGAHGGLTVLHGGGNLQINTEGAFNYNAATRQLVRLDGRSFAEAGFEVGQVVQLEGESYTRTIVAIGNASPSLRPADAFKSWGAGAMLELSDPLRANGTVLASGNKEDFLIHVADAFETTITRQVKIEVEALVPGNDTSLQTVVRLTDGTTWASLGFEVGGTVFIEGLAGAFKIAQMAGNRIVLLNAALGSCCDDDGIATLTITTYDITRSGGQRVGGDHFVVVGGGGPNSPLVIYGDTSQDGIWYSGHSYDQLGLEFGEKPFDAFPRLPDNENEDDEWVFALANPFDFHGNDIIDASKLFANTANAATTISVGITAYGGMGDDLIIGSQTGDHLAGGSGNDTIIGQRGTDHIYGDSGVNVDILTRALTIATLDASPAPGVDPATPKADSTFAPTESPVRDPLGKRPADTTGLVNIPGAGSDHIEGNGTGIADGTPDIIFADHGEVIQLVIDPNRPFPLDQKIQTTFLSTVLEINSKEAQTGGDDVIIGSEIDDVIIGGAGNDALDGRQGDDLIFGDNVNLRRMGGADGNLYDDIKSLRFQTLAGTLIYSRSDRPASAGYDINAVSGDNSGVLMVSRDALGNPIARDFRDPNGPSWWSEYQIDYAEYHSFAVEAGLTGAGSFGNDYIAGGAGNDYVFGQLGDDIIQGDGTIDGAVTGRGDGTANGFTALTGHVGAAREMPEAGDPVGALKVVDSKTYASDGSDYVEGGGGCDTIFGGLGQDDIVGGSSSFFSLVAPENRPDGCDVIFGGGGLEISRNDVDLPGDGTAAAGRHARDADTIAGDNADIVRLVGVNGVDLLADDNISLTNPAVFSPIYKALYNTRNGLFLSFAYDRSQTVNGTLVADYAAENGERVVVRGVTLLDYTPGGPDFKPGLFDLQTSLGENKGAGWNSTLGFWSKVDIGGADEVHGETGDDTIYLGAGNDIAFGDAENDDIIGGWGSDWISGGTGVDGVLGDDGRISTSRNTRMTGAGAYGTQYAESLFGIYSLLASDPDARTSQGNVINEFLYTPGHVQEELINVEFSIVKSVDLTPFDSDAGSIFAPVYSADPNQHNPRFADDVIFGGLGDDFLHGGSGDDAIGGHEALPAGYVQLFVNGVVAGLVRTDFSRPWNPSDILLFGDGDPHWNEPTPVRQRTGEFWLYDEYDPRRTILFYDNGQVWKSGSPAGLKQFFLNAPDTEGELVGGYTQFQPNGTPIESSYLKRPSDGNDRIFGDMGNDWIVGGTGRDHIYGGFGNDLLNADDVVGVPGGDGTPSYDETKALNNAPETHRVWEDRVFGGAGLDILIGNTGGDRLIDHLGEFNSYIVPFAPFGIATVSRQVPPQLWDFLAAQAFSDGVDMTRTADIGPNHESRYSNVIQQQGDPYGEIGLVTQRDHGYWQDQAGPPTDPQAGNIPGGRRDIQRTADFNDRTLNGFQADLGSFTAANGVMSVSALNGGTTASGVFLLDDYLPTYYEVTATFNLDKPVGTWKANGYIIFDYHSDVDFKFAGINVSTNKIEMGYVDAGGWHFVAQSNKPVQIKPNTNYDVLVAVNGNNVTVQVAGVNWFSYNFKPRLDDYGQPIPLNGGMVGVGSNGAKGTVDNFRVQVLPPTWTVNKTDDFAPPVAELPRVSQSSGWLEASGRLSGTVNGTAPAVQTVDLGVRLLANSTLEMEVDIRTAGTAGFIFDRYDALHYKFVALDVAGDRVIVGHASADDGMVVDASYSFSLEATRDYRLKVTMQGAGLGIFVNGANVVNFGFNAALVDGAFGLMVVSGQASFDNFRLATDDQQFNSALKLAETSSATLSSTRYVQAEPIADDDLQRLYQTALKDWSASGLVSGSDVERLAGVTLVVKDLEGSTLARAVGDTIMIDLTAAGAGWYIDADPASDAEFSQGLVTAGVDLLTVLRHEIGHLLGFEHDEIALMGETLATGTRISVETAATTVTPVSAPVAKPVHTEPQPVKSGGKPVKAAAAELVFDPVTGALIDRDEARLLFAVRESESGKVLALATAGALYGGVRGKAGIPGGAERAAAIEGKPPGNEARHGWLARLKGVFRKTA